MELLTTILKAGVDAGASDVHIRAGKPITFRIASRLVTADGPDAEPDWVERICQEILPPHLREQYDARRELDFSYQHPQAGRFRVAAFLQRGSRSIVFRAVKNRVPDFEALNLPQQILKLAGVANGIIVVAGATGAGKSTTLAAVVQHINRTRACRVVTIEDPIEYLFEDELATIDQREVGIDTESFQSGIRTVLRQDPDVIMIGELRDELSLDAALRAADTGHLVLTTIHANTAAQTLHRILDLLPDTAHAQTLRQISLSLRGVVCQRMTERKGGGVIPTVEVLISTPAVRKLLHDGNLAKLEDAIASGAADGMQNFNGSLMDLVNRGLITREEAMDKSTNQQELRMNFQGITMREGARILG